MFKKLATILLAIYLTNFALASSTFAADYTLPYPGLLPDSPLYIFKVIRDNVASSLIQNPIDKSFYQLFLSDKRLKAGEVLINKNKTSLGVTTILISEERFREAVRLARSSKKNNNLISKLIVSSVKHEETISKLLDKDPQLQLALKDIQNQKILLTGLLLN